MRSLLPHFRVTGEVMHGDHHLSLCYSARALSCTVLFVQLIKVTRLCVGIHKRIYIDVAGGSTLARRDAFVNTGDSV